MEQIEFFEIPSPCIGVCQAGKRGYCLGCYRSRDERLYWHKLSPDVKRKIVAACARRKQRAESARRRQQQVDNSEQQQTLWEDEPDQ
ncbi:uncharacterized protein HMF8227_02443 [Saliniradius amylolyticus]|uniref:DUF1289 domain-containing protein n=1 Tax=Saliniradius amylolyticus TaxID=2183582 RepID=A0A2S2E5G1_9ALTE|nr:DUF1289 domain-containing protein [Saliniradius amylolyticus]AWL12895.1 uncharacterized protein HMF8227_02443 [Saliniradius amylolyticus]